MIKVKIEHEDNNGKEFGYGVYVNGYIRDDFFDPPDVAGHWASECVPHGSPPSAIKKAERRVKKNAMRAYKRACTGT